MKLPVEELNSRARMEIRTELMPMSRIVCDIKSQVRAGLHWEEAKTKPPAYLEVEHRGGQSLAGEEDHSHRAAHQQQSGHSKRTQFSCATITCSWSKMMKTLHRLPEDQVRGIEGYFEAANGQLSRDLHILSGSTQRRFAHFQKSMAHESALKRRL